MDSSTTGREVVMSVHPGYAEAIMDGRKKVEFRKRPLARDVTVVWVYATAPVQLVIGYFKVGSTVTATPRILWRRFGSVGCISRADFDRYYADSVAGVGILVADVTRLAVPMLISEFLPSGVPPQSIAYVSAINRLREDVVPGEFVAGAV